MTDQRPERRSHAPLTRDHLPPGTRPEDIDPETDASAVVSDRAVDRPPKHPEDTRGAGPTAERPHLEGPEQNPR